MRSEWTSPPPPIVLPRDPAPKLWPGLLLVMNGAALVVLVLGSTGRANTKRGIKERVRREQNSMDGGGREEK